MIFLSTVMDEERLTLTTQLSTAQGPMGIAYAG